MGGELAPAELQPGLDGHRVARQPASIRPAGQVDE